MDKLRVWVAARAALPPGVGGLHWGGVWGSGWNDLMGWTSNGLRWNGGPERCWAPRAASTPRMGYPS